MPFAEGTQVDAGKTRLDIEAMLSKFACETVGVMREPGFATVLFRRQGWAVQMRVALPQLSDAPKQRKPGYHYMTEAQRLQWVMQQEREKWRQLMLVLKAKFTALENGIESFEESFMAHLVVGGDHVGQRLLPALRQAQESGQRLALPSGEVRHG